MKRKNMFRAWLFLSVLFGTLATLGILLVLQPSKAETFFLVALFLIPMEGFFYLMLDPE